MMQDNKIFTPLCCWQIETTYVCKLFAVLSLWDVSCLYKAEYKLGTGAVRVLFPAGAMHANIFIYS